MAPICPDYGKIHRDIEAKRKAEEARHPVATWWKQEGSPTLRLGFLVALSPIWVPPVALLTFFDWLIDG
jgi:hypothetical protein